MNTKTKNQLAQSSKLQLMTHIVAGYPDMKTSKNLIKTMADAGADYIEIQIPFSDPMADGPTIMKANQHALDRGVRLEDCFSLMKEMSSKVSIPLLFMTYANIPFRYGLKDFVDTAADCGASGIILPDLPVDEKDEEILGFFEQCNKRDIDPILVMSPGMSEERLKHTLTYASGMVYCTLKIGITGSEKGEAKASYSLLEKIRSMKDIALAGGFGIKEKSQFKQLENKADVAVVGSHLMRVLDEKGVSEVGEWIRALKS